MASFRRRFIIVGDVGGTNCRLELICLDCGFEGSGRPIASFSARYRTTSAPSVLDLLKRFALEPGFMTISNDCNAELISLCVCGPVTDGVAILNNPTFGETGWTVDSTYLSKELGIRVHILNDFNAVGLSLLQLSAEDIHVLYDGKGHSAPQGVKAWLGPGTGLGQAFAILGPEGGGKGEMEWRIFGSEGGVSDFVARTKDEWLLKQYIAQQGAGGDPYGFVDVESVVSGTGITHIYQWLRGNQTVSNTALDMDIMSSDHPARLICQHGALAYTNIPLSTHNDPFVHDPLCCQAIGIFLAALGAEAANLALRFQATGGVYIAGGIASKIMPLIEDGRVAEGYLSKGRSLVAYDNCPLYAVSKSGDDLGLTGAFINAMKFLT